MPFEHFDRFLEKCDESSCPEFAILNHGTFNRRPSGDAMQIHLEPAGEKTSQLGGPDVAPGIEKVHAFRAVLSPLYCSALFQSCRFVWIEERGVLTHNRVRESSRCCGWYEICEG